MFVAISKQDKMNNLVHVWWWCWFWFV